MFGLLTRTPKTEKIGEVPPGPSQEYIDLCQRLNIPHIVPKENPIRTAMRKHSIPLLNADDVHRHMLRIKPKKKTYGWFCLINNSGDYHGSLFDNGDFTSNSYKKPVPIRMLYRAERILKEVPMADIFVTDYEVPNPDPFICARFENEYFVFGKWDEPTFDDRATDV